MFYGDMFVQMVDASRLISLTYPGTNLLKSKKDLYLSFC